MAFRTITTEDFYVGEDIFIEFRLFDELERKQATGQTVLLISTRPTKTTITTALTEVVGSPGLYRGVVSLDVAGPWDFEANVGNKTVFRYNNLYVSE
jgi:hypothetical protein